MDSNQSGVVGIVALVISVLGSLIAIINHKRIRSKCCERKIEVSIDIESTEKQHPVSPV
jgi:hypothetical protein